MNENVMTNQPTSQLSTILAGKDHKTELLETQRCGVCLCVCVGGGGVSTGDKCLAAGRSR